MWVRPAGCARLVGWKASGGGQTSDRPSGEGGMRHAYTRCTLCDACLRRNH